MGESTLQFTNEQLDELTRALIEDADANNSGTLTFEELQTALSKHPGLVENLSFRLVNYVIVSLKDRSLCQTFFLLIVLQIGFNLAQSHVEEEELSAFHIG